MRNYYKRGWAVGWGVYKSNPLEQPSNRHGRGPDAHEGNLGQSANNLGDRLSKTLSRLRMAYLRSHFPPDIGATKNVPTLRHP